MTTRKLNSLELNKSRYVVGGKTEIGTKLEWWEKNNIARSSSDIVYTVEHAYVGRPDLLAATFYEDSHLWWVICQYNNILDPFNEIVVGRILLIPTKDRLMDILSGGVRGGINSKRTQTNILPQIVV